jgi:hypothetical protein
LPEIDFLPGWYARKVRHRRMARLQGWLAVASGLGLICCLAVVFCHGKAKAGGAEGDRTVTTATTLPAMQPSAVPPGGKSSP